MPHYACHRLIIPFRGEELMQTVELDEDGFFRARASLHAETSHTVWLAGACVLLPQGMVPVCGETLQALLARVERDAVGGRSCLWHLAGMPADLPSSCPVNRWDKIG